MLDVGAQSPGSQPVAQSWLEEALASLGGKAGPTGHHTGLLGRNAPDFSGSEGTPVKDV